MIKFTMIMRRKASLSHDEFVAHHRDNHAPLFCGLAEVKKPVRKYVQCHAIDIALPGMPPVNIDGITELWFDDVDGIGAVFGSQNYLDQIRSDEEKFIDLPDCEFLVSTENVVIERRIERFGRREQLATFSFESRDKL